MIHIKKLNEMCLYENYRTDNTLYKKAMRMCGIDDSTISQIEALANRLKNDNLTFAEQICNIAIDNINCLKNYGDNVYAIEIPYMIPERFGKKDYRETYLQIYPFDSETNDNSVLVRAYYAIDDNTSDVDDIDLSHFNKKEQQDILTAFQNEINRINAR